MDTSDDIVQQTTDRSAERRSISEWSEDNRPRERLLRVGAQALTDAELLAILIHSGSTSQDAVALMQDVLHQCDDELSRLSRMTYEELTSFKGIGPAKAVTLMAASEFGRRRLLEKPQPRMCFDKSQLIFERILRPRFMDLTVEECWLALFDHSLHEIACVKVSRGGPTSADADIRYILLLALQKKAFALCLAHNHPSGRLVPGRDDDVTTHNLFQACHYVGIRMLDHFIVYEDRYYSYADEGRLS